MSAPTLPPPLPPVCLLRTYLSRGVKGGTVVAEDVLELAVHRQRILDPDGYRECSSPCRTCGEKTLHAHCFRVRTLRPAAPKEKALLETIRLYLCPSCGAVFSVLSVSVRNSPGARWRGRCGGAGGERHRFGRGPLTSPGGVIRSPAYPAVGWGRIRQFR